MSGAVYIFAGGGTGGHLYPGLAVAEALLELHCDARIVFACSDRPIDRRVLDPLPYPIVPQPARPIPKRICEVPGFLRASFAAAAQATEMIGDLKPAAVLGLGGFAAGAVVRRASARGIRSAMLNVDAVVGRANRYLAGRVGAIFTQFESTRGQFAPRLRSKVRAVGCPIRKGLSAGDRAAACRRFALDADRKTLLVYGASSGSVSINQAVLSIAADLDSLADRWQVLHVTGPGKLAAPASAWRAHRIDASVLEYCGRMDLAYAAADLAVGRAGAGTVAELAATATPAVLIPYPHHADRQQHHNAAELVRAGAAVLCEESADAAVTAAGLRRALLEILQDDAAVARMHQAAAGLARPGAAEAVASWLGR